MKRSTLLITGFVLAAFLVMGTLAWAQTDVLVTAGGTTGINAGPGDAGKMEIAKSKMIKVEARKVAHIKIRDDIRAVLKLPVAERDRARAKLAEEVAVRRGLEVSATLKALRVKASLTQADRDAIDEEIRKVHNENVEVHVARVLDRADRINTLVTDMIARLRVRINDSTDAIEKARLTAALDKLVSLQVSIETYINDLQADHSILEDGAASTKEVRAMQHRMIELRVHIKRLVEGVRTFAERVPRRGSRATDVRPALAADALVAIEGVVEAPTEAEVSADVDATMVVVPVAEVDPTTGGGQ